MKSEIAVLLEFIKSPALTLTKFTEQELQYIPVECLIEYADPYGLLRVWHKLPQEYRSNFNLQIKLPCFVHYNRPDWTTHWDGPPSSQEACHFCKKGLLR